MGAASRASSGSPARRLALGELLLPTSGAVGFLARAALVPAFWRAALRERVLPAPRSCGGCASVRERARSARGRGLSGAAAGPGSPAQPRGADGRGARRLVARSARCGRRSGRRRDSRRRARSATRSISTTSRQQVHEAREHEHLAEVGPAPPQEARAGRAGATLARSRLEVELLGVAALAREHGAQELGRAAQLRAGRGKGRAARGRGPSRGRARGSGPRPAPRAAASRRPLSCTRPRRAPRSRSRARSSGRSSPGTRRRRRSGAASSVRR